MKKFLTFILVLAMVLSVSSFAMAANYDISAGNITISVDDSGKQTVNGVEDASPVITGTSDSNTITVTTAMGQTAKFTINNFTAKQIIIKDASAEITITGTNEIKKGNYSAGIYVTSGSLVIKGDGNLTVGKENNGYGAAIGSGQYDDMSGTIRIESGTVLAYSNYGAAIGAGQYGAMSGDIEISDGTVTAKGGYGAAIGAGQEGAMSGDIEISDGTVNATTSRGAGIGGGQKGEASGSIIISGGSVTAKSTAFGTGIGSGMNSSLSGSVSISGDAEVTATSDVGAGIGSGSPNSGTAGTVSGTISISDTATVNASSNSGSGIGSGKNGNISEGAAISISDKADVTAAGAAKIGAVNGKENKGSLAIDSSVKLNGIDLSNATADNINTALGFNAAGNADTQITITIVPDSNPSAPPTNNSTPSSGSGISVKYNGGNSFSTSKSDVPTGVEIDGVPVTFNGTGSNFSVGCISSDAKWVTVRWNSTSVTTNFTPDGLVECTTVSIPKTGDMSIWAAIAQFLGF